MDDMRPSRRRPAPVLLLLLAMLLAPVPWVVSAPPAAACSCIDATPEETWANADVVVVAAITDRQESDGQFLYTARVSAVYVGEATESLRFTTESAGEACGWDVEPSDDERIIVLNDGGPGIGLRTSSCTMYAAQPIPDDYVGTERTLDPTTGAEAEEVDPTRQPWWPLWVGLGSGVLVLLALWLVLRRPLTDR